jgi:hypothetical protein
VDLLQWNVDDFHMWLPNPQVVMQHHDQPSSVFVKLSSSSHALNLHGYTAHHYEHLDNDRDNEETAILVKDFVFLASFNIQTPLQVTTVHLNLLNLLMLQHPLIVSSTSVAY